MAVGYSFFVLFALLDAAFATAFLVYILMARPWEFMQYDLILALPKLGSGLAIVSLFLHKIIRKEFYIKWNYAHGALLVYALWVFLSIIPSDQSSTAFASYFDLFLKLIIVYFLIINSVDKEEQLRPIEMAFILGLFEKTLMGYFRTNIFGASATEERLSAIGIIGNSNDLAAIMLIALPFSLSLVKEVRNKIQKLGLEGIIIFIHVLLIWKTKSRGAIISLGVMSMAYVWIKSKKIKILRPMILVVLLSLSGVLSLIDRRSDDVEGSTSNRLTFWRAGVNMAIRNPILGVGYEGFNSHLLQYANGAVGSEGANRTVHSNWILALSETGFVGFLFYMALWVSALVAAYRISEFYPHYFLAMVGYGSAITFLSHTYLLFPYILLALTLAKGSLYFHRLEKKA